MRIFVTPRPGLKVRDPRRLSEHVPAEGAYYEDSTDWRRHERDRAVTISDGPKTAAAPAAPKPSKKGD